uniref:Uncharacterized protein n=1 Tax=Anguilla anguilla TaxID=7936 RepID=A0A0E9Q738_ANGAN
MLESAPQTFNKGTPFHSCGTGHFCNAEYIHSRASHTSTSGLVVIRALNCPESVGELLK